MPIKGVLTSQRVPVKIWADLHSVESSALDQLKNVASLPFVFKHVAVMPDVHYGKGATVGSVIATKEAICPAAVGVDIGCGMCAVKLPTGYRDAILDDLPNVRKRIEDQVPVGFDSNKRLTSSVECWDGWGAPPSVATDKTKYQLGTLGGGNHFIEICLDQLNNMWVVLHSGSRNIGKVVAEMYIEKAKGLMKQMLIGLPDPDLSYLPRETDEFDAYIRDLNWCQSYAAKNREEMLNKIMMILTDNINWRKDAGQVINCHHNYVAWENHYGENVMVTRKGAVRARAGDLGIIPGSMGTRSYIVRGLGNPESFHSCSHGAGRRMSRGMAKRTFSLQDLADQTKGIECRKDEGVIDEIPAAYKDIDEVMANQTDLVEPIAQLHQVLCIKG